MSTTYPAAGPVAGLAGQLVLPGDPDYDRGRQAWNLALDQRPAAVIWPESAADVAAAVGRGLRIAPQGTGHGAAPLGPLDDIILLRTDRMGGIRIDPRTRIARTEAGVTWLDVVEAAARHGLAALAGSSPDTGVTGYTLGGGISFLGRKFGLAANSVTAIEVVTADGHLVRADHEHQPDLFWALRGGGGSFGIVTALEFRLFPVTEAYAGAIKDALAPWTAPRMCLNFAETRHPAAPLWTDQAYRRLRQIKAAVDPRDLIRANHPVPTP
jgi:FAD/FMN-containing dehydrogenase